MKVDDGFGKDAPPVDTISGGEHGGHQEDAPSTPGLMARLRSFFTGRASERHVDVRWYESFENLLPLLLALVAIGIKLWLYW